MAELPMKIKGLAPWFGSKRNMAPTIVEMMGPHKVYWEPFCGSMAVLFAKPPARMETVNDLHGDLINLARVIQDRELGFRLYDKLSRTLCAEQFFRESKERWISSEPSGQPDIDRAYDYFVASWMGMNGVSGTARCNYQFSLRWCASGGETGQRWANVVGSIPAWHKRLKKVLILQRDAFEIVDNIRDEANTVIYCDPPYLEKADKYVHDFTAEQHEKLASFLERFKKARVFVSYYDHPDLDELYGGWKKIYNTKTRQSLRNATRGPEKKARTDKKEVILTNTEPTDLFSQ